MRLGNVTPRMVRGLKSVGMSWPLSRAVPLGGVGQA